MNFISKVVQKIIRDYGDHSMDEKLRVEGQQICELKRQLHNMQGKPMHVVFVCHRGALWNSLKPVYDACMEDDKVKATIVTIPNKKQVPGKGLDHEEYVWEGAKEFFADYECDVICGYDEETDKWFDLKRLDPDYVFFQTAYDICRPPEYKSDVVSLYAKLAYVHYGMPFMGGMIAEESFPRNFLMNTYFHFAEFKEMQKYYIERNPENAIHKHENVILTGYPKLDGAQKNVGCESVSWKNPRDKGLFRIMWTPRWSTNEGNCTFFDYIEKMPDFVEKKQEYELLFRPHPQAFSEYLEKGEMTEKQINDYKARYENSDRMGIDPQGEYLPSFYSSDVLITDESSIMPEYFLTGKPIIFTYKETHLNSFATKLAEGFYWAKDWSEVQGYIEKLKAGDDPLMAKRKELMETEFYLPELGAGHEIKEILIKDYERKL